MPSPWGPRVQAEGSAVPSRVVPTSGLVGVGTALASVLLLSCGGGEGGPGLDPGDEIASVLIQPPTASVDVGDTQQFTATVRNRDGDVVNAAVEWSSSDATVATVDQTGLATGVGTGTANIVAVVSSATDVQTAAALTVTPATPATPSNVQSTAISDTQIDVTWEDNSDDEDEFVVEREQVGGGGEAATATFVQAGTVGANETVFHDTNLSPNTSYRYRVTACNGAGCADPAEGEAGGTTTHETLVLETEALSDGVVGQSYQATLAAAGGTGSFQWEVISGALPGGLSLSSDGVISGTPEGAGTFNFTVEVTSGGQTESRELSIIVHEVLTVTTEELPDGQTGTEYGHTLAAAGGAEPYDWSLESGPLPDGVVLTSAGVLEGTPTEEGTFQITVSVASDDGQQASKELSLTIHGEELPPKITTSDLPDGRVGVEYVGGLEASDGDGNFDWELPDGEALPPGFLLDPATGDIRGTATRAGTFTFQVRVTSAGLSTTAELTIVVDGPDQATTILETPAPAAPGQTFMALLNLDMGPNGRTPGAVAVKITWDPAELELEAFDDFSGDHLWKAVRFPGDGELRVVVSDPSGLPAVGSLLEIPFTVRAAAGTDAALTTGLVQSIEAGSFEDFTDELRAVSVLVRVR